MYGEIVIISCLQTNISNPKMLFRNLLYFIGIIVLVSCTDFAQIKFDKIKWMTKDDMTFPYRNKMLRDLTTNHKLVGLKHSEVIDVSSPKNSTFLK